MVLLLVLISYTIRDEIGTFFTGEQWDDWFDSYFYLVERYANISESMKVDALSLGDGFTFACMNLFHYSNEYERILTPTLATTQRNRWVNLVKKIRQVYSGDLTYSASSVWSLLYLASFLLTIFREEKRQTLHGGGFWISLE